MIGDHRAQPRLIIRAERTGRFLKPATLAEQKLRDGDKRRSRAPTPGINDCAQPEPLGRLPNIPRPRIFAAHRSRIQYIGQENRNAKSANHPRDSDRATNHTPTASQSAPNVKDKIEPIAIKANHERIARRSIIGEHFIGNREVEKC